MVHDPFRPDTHAYKREHADREYVAVESVIKIQVGVNKPAVILTVEDAISLMHRLQKMFGPASAGSFDRITP